MKTMKTYIVKTSSSTNDMLLHSLMKSEFKTTDLNEARSVFEGEIKQLEKECTRADLLPYSPTDDEMRHAIQCSLLSIDEDDEIEYIEGSDYFFSK